MGWHQEKAVRTAMQSNGQCGRLQRRLGSGGGARQHRGTGGWRQCDACSGRRGRARPALAIRATSVRAPQDGHAVVPPRDAPLAQRRHAARVELVLLLQHARRQLLGAICRVHRHHRLCQDGPCSRQGRGATGVGRWGLGCWTGAGSSGGECGRGVAYQAWAGLAGAPAVTWFHNSAAGERRAHRGAARA